MPSAGRAQPDISVERDIDSGGESVETVTMPVALAAEEIAGLLARSGLVSHTLRIDVEDTGAGARARTWSGCDLSVPADIALRVRWTLTGWMSNDQGPSGAIRSIRLTACDPHPGQGASALWGRGHRQGDVTRSAVRIQGLAGPHSLLVPRVQGGYDPRSRVVMARWGESEPLRSRAGAWEGAITDPPATLFDEPVPVRLTTAAGAGADVCVDQRGALSAIPGYLLAGSTRKRERTSGHAHRADLLAPGERTQIRAIEGPWPVGGRWWAGERARAYVRATLEDGRVVLLVWSAGEWMAEGLDN